MCFPQVDFFHSVVNFNICIPMLNWRTCKTMAAKSRFNILWLTFRLQVRNHNHALERYLCIYISTILLWCCFSQSILHSDFANWPAFDLRPLRVVSLFDRHDIEGCSLTCRVCDSSIVCYTGKMINRWIWKSLDRESLKISSTSNYLFVDDRAAFYRMPFLLRRVVFWSTITVYSSRGIEWYDMIYWDRPSISWRGTYLQ